MLIFVYYYSSPFVMVRSLLLRKVKAVEKFSCYHGTVLAYLLEIKQDNVSSIS